MKALSKNDVKVLGVLVDWGCKVKARDVAGNSFTYGYKEAEDLIFEVAQGMSISEAVILDLKLEGADVSKPNEELTDTQKGLIQLLFEVEKAIA